MRTVLMSSFMLAALAAGCTIVQQPGSPAYVSSGTASLEVNVDRPGSDYRSFDVASARPEECRDTCLVEPQCVAFTFANPGVQGPSARCWLKSAVPAQSPNGCCVSGVKNAPPEQPPQTGWAGMPPAAAPPPVEQGPPPREPTDVEQGPPPRQPTYAEQAAPPGGWTGAPPPSRHGLELNVNRPGLDYANFDLPQPRPNLCHDACMRDARCAAFTYVNPRVQGPSARCWLKTAAPPPVPSNCCISGVK